MGTLTWPPNPLDKYTEKLKPLGLFNIIRSLAKGNPLDYDRAYKLENSTVFAHLYAESIEAMAEHMYRESQKNTK